MTFSCDLELGDEGFEYAIPVLLERGDGGEYEASPLGHESSPLSVYDRESDPSVLSSSTRASRADGFVLRQSGLESGDHVPVVPYTVLE